MADTPSSTHTARFRPGAQAHEVDGRLYSPVFLRNSPPVIAALARIFGDDSGTVLEIGAGTGQHSAAFSLAFPKLNWVPSEPDAIHRQSITAWATFLKAPAKTPLALDAGAEWGQDPAVQNAGPFTAILTMNVTHIAPYEVTEGLFRGAGQTLASGGQLLIYGPFKDGGTYFGDGNRAFDAGLRADNPAWGLRDLQDLNGLAIAAGLTPHPSIKMPANNLLLSFRKNS